MAGSLRVILEIGKKRKVVAGAFDWPGLDRSGTSEDDALAKLSSYLPRYSGVSDRAGMVSASNRSRTLEVTERVPGSSTMSRLEFPPSCAANPEAVARPRVDVADPVSRTPHRSPCRGSAWEMEDRDLGS